MKITLGMIFLVVLSMLGNNSRQAFTIGTNYTTSSKTNATKKVSKEVELKIGKNIRSIFQDSKGNMWFGTDGNGAYKYDGKVLKHYTPQDGLLGNYIHTITQDKNGNIWFGTNEAIVSYNGIFFINYTKDKESQYQQGFTSYVDQRGELWFGTFSGYYNFKNNKLEFHSLANDENNYTYSVYSILETKEGKMFFGTDHKGIFVKDDKQMKNINDLNIARGSVRSLYQDKTGRIWIGNNGNGLYCYENNQLRNLSTENNLIYLEKRNKITMNTGLANIYSIAEDIAGNIWVGTIDKGLWRYDDKKFTNIMPNDGLQNEGVLNIYKDNLGKLWIGQLFGGLDTFDGSRFIVISKATPQDNC